MGTVNTAQRKINVHIPLIIQETVKQRGVALDTVDFSWLLGYVDYTDQDIIYNMFAYTGETENGVILPIIIQPYDLDAIDQGLAKLDGCPDKATELSDDRLASMISCALGFIDYDKHLL